MPAPRRLGERIEPAAVTLGGFAYHDAAAAQLARVGAQRCECPVPLVELEEPRELRCCKCGKALR